LSGVCPPFHFVLAPHSMLADALPTMLLSSKIFTLMVLATTALVARHFTTAYRLVMTSPRPARTTPLVRHFVSASRARPISSTGSLRTCVFGASPVPRLKFRTTWIKFSPRTRQAWWATGIWTTGALTQLTRRAAGWTAGFAVPGTSFLLHPYDLKPASLVIGQSCLISISSQCA